MPSLALAMIVKDEALYLREFLKRHRDFFDEWIIVDTGSTDETLQIIEDAGIEPKHFSWVDDFAQARNYAFSLCRADYIAYWDADELLLEDDQQILKEKLHSHDGWILPIKHYSKTRPSVDYKAPDGSFLDIRPAGPDYPYQLTDSLRIVRREKQFYWISPVHEVLKCDFPHSLARLDCYVHHLGPLDENAKGKSKEEHYRRISQAMLLNPELKNDPKLLFEAARHVSEKETKLYYLQKAHLLAPRDLTILKETVNVLMEKSALGQAKDMCELIIEQSGDALEGYLARSECTRQMQGAKAASKELKLVFRKFQGLPIYNHRLAKLAMEAGDMAAAKSYAKRAYDKAPEDPEISELHAFLLRASNF